MANVIDKIAGLVVGPQGPQGPQGPKGDTGQTGQQGATGATGATPNLTVGTVTTLEPDSPATATITGTAENPVLNLGLPKGRTGEVSQAEFDGVAGDVNQLKNTINYLYSKSNPDEYGIITYPTEWGYPTLSDGSYTWITSRNFISTKRTNPVKVKSGDVIHLMDAKEHAYFAIYSADGVTWENLVVTTTSVSTTIPNDGYVIVTVRKNPSVAMTDEEFASVFDYIAIFRKGYTNKAMELSKGVETAIGMVTGVEVLCNEKWYTWQWITAKETEQTNTGKDLIGGGTFAASKGDKFKVWGDFWTEFPSNFSSIGVIVREGNSSGTIIWTRNFYDFSSPQEFTITDERTATIELTIIAKSPAIDKGYNANFYYHVVLCRVNESGALDDVLTEAGDAWEV